MAGYLPVDTPPGAAPLPLGTPVPAKPASPAAPAPVAKGPQPPRVSRKPKSSGKGRIRKPGGLGRRSASKGSR